MDNPSGDGSSYLFRVDTAATPERLLLPAPALEALVFKPVVDRILREARVVLQDALHNDKPADKVCCVCMGMHVLISMINSYRYASFLTYRYTFPALRLEPLGAASSRHCRWRVAATGRVPASKEVVLFARWEASLGSTV